jgi:predicted aconitase
MDEKRRAGLVLDVSGLPVSLLTEDAFFPVFGALVGRLAGETVAAVTGLPAADEDQLKALCAGAASTGAVALIHVVGVTPEAKTLESIADPDVPVQRVTSEMIGDARATLSLAEDGPIDSVALGSPHFSAEECRRLVSLAGGGAFSVPVYVCLGRHTLEALRRDGTDGALAALGVEVVTDTCVVVTPILPESPGVMMTNSAKFAHYAQGNTGHLPVFGTLAECVASAQAGRVVRLPGVWS